jgi:peptidyl-tRNA hydrolase, PTH1 family
LITKPIDIVRALSAVAAFLFGKNRQVDSVGKVFFGIGNPGKRFNNTRHNVGFAALERFSCAVTDKRSRRGSTWKATLGLRENVSLALVMPNTFVNRCGEALVDCIEAMRCPLSSCLVIVDDYNLPMGTLRMRSRGSDGGHNGLKSIISYVGEDFPRLRIGIGPMPTGSNIVEFVLGKFNREETVQLQALFKNVDEAMMQFALNGIDAAMNKCNKLKSVSK